MQGIPTVKVRDDELALIGEVGDFVSLVVTPRYCAVGEWTLVLPGDGASAELFSRTANTGGGIVIVLDGETLLSGPFRALSWNRDEDTGQPLLTVTGVDDNWHLTTRLVYPEPAVEPEDMDGTPAYYRVASTNTESIMRDLVSKNLGAGALAARRLTGLTLATNLGRGKVQASPKYRFDVLLDALTQLSTLSRVGADPLTDLAFRIVQIGTGLVFQVYRSTSRVGTARFSFEIGNLADAQYTASGPTLTYAVLGAGNLESDAGARIAAALFPYSRSDTYYPARVEGFVDVGQIDPGDGDAQDQLDQQAADAFENGGGQTGVALTPIDTDRLRFGRDYVLGDHVSVELPGLAFVAPVRQVTLTYTAEDGAVVDIGVGTAEGAYQGRNPGVSRRLVDIRRYLRKLKTIK